MSSPVKRLVTVSVERDTPLDVLRALREVSDCVELVHAGGQNWWLGFVRPSPAMAFGISPLLHERVHQKLAPQLQRQGFRFLGQYTDEQLSPTYLRAELEFMLGRSDKDLEKDMAATEANADGTVRQQQVEAVILDKLESEGRSIAAYVMRNRRSVMQSIHRERAAELAAKEATP